MRLRRQGVVEGNEAIVRRRVEAIKIKNIMPRSAMFWVTTR